MDLRELKSITFQCELFLDRKTAKYCFEPGPDRVSIIPVASATSIEELELLFLPFNPTKLERLEDMFSPEVLRFLATLLAPQRQAAPAPVPVRAVTPPPSAPKANMPAPRVAPAVTAAPKAAPVNPTPGAPAKVSVPLPVLPPQKAAETSVPRPKTPPPKCPAPAPPPAPPPSRTAPPAAEAAPPPKPNPPPAVKIASAREDLRERVFEKLSTEEGKAAILSGRLDTEIQTFVEAFYGEVRPRQILAEPSRERDRSDNDVVMDQAMTSQAFGAQLQLEKADLFMLAKSAILQSMTEADRRNIQVIKQSLLLGKCSPAYAKRLDQYYQEIMKFLRGRKVEDSLVELIHKSRYVYFDGLSETLPKPAVALGVADAFVTLREAGKFTVEILRILPEKVRKRAYKQAKEVLEQIDQLLKDSCYNEYRKAIDSRLSGGDHCAFVPTGPTSYALWIFDVSGHEERASRLRDALVAAFGGIKDRSDPARVVATLGRFVEQVPFPEDVFVSMVYGVVDLQESRFVYANAGHHPPYLVRDNRLVRLEETGGLALNMGDASYANGIAPLVPMDCLVLYTDGLTEAVQHQAVAAGRKELFGHRRLETAIAQQKIGSQKARRAVESILAAVRDQGFEIEDDITIQVYRHI